MLPLQHFGKTVTHWNARWWLSVTSNRVIDQHEGLLYFKIFFCQFNWMVKITRKSGLKKMLEDVTTKIWFHLSSYSVVHRIQHRRVLNCLIKTENPIYSQSFTSQCIFYKKSLKPNFCFNPLNMLLREALSFSPHP